MILWTFRHAIAVVDLSYIKRPSRALSRELNFCYFTRIVKLWQFVSFHTIGHPIQIEDVDGSTEVDWGRNGFGREETFELCQHLISYPTIFSVNLGWFIILEDFAATRFQHTRCKSWQAWIFSCLEPFPRQGYVLRQITREWIMHLMEWDQMGESVGTLLGGCCNTRYHSNI